MSKKCHNVKGYRVKAKTSGRHKHKGYTVKGHRRCK